MRRVALVLVLLMLVPTVVASPDSTVEINLERRLTNFDLGLEGGEISPNGLKILLFGADGYTQITMYAQRDPNSEFGYYIDTSKPGNLAERENREWNENRRENKPKN